MNVMMCCVMTVRARIKYVSYLSSFGVIGGSHFFAQVFFPRIDTPNIAPVAVACPETGNGDDTTPSFPWRWW